jgi:hypothetical protein
LRVRAKFNNLSLIHAHAPTEEKNKYIKDSFYEKLETVVTRCPKNDMKILLETLMLGWGLKIRQICCWEL